ncbi:FAD-binding oxidoreductase [Actinoplanes sp. TBRC 11911]|uniref:NAD(P)/FAD-dependent oxidoreductase n=1 Tax=Actinoplanes sp. TBRC 11911 TaxID=2729386 RepID=UPI00145C8085|nr:FAD-binding oxidoreductase [Actinoplanes sp. TBRC 11911]NMO56128.1 FAD-binding oxidoreductase [Actinoplanes sp. TBRC 11911]
MTFWDDRLDDAARQALQPGQPDDLNRSPDVLVVGGGAVGLAVAAACRRAGLGQVVTIEGAARLASGASGSNGGAIAPDMHLLTDPPEMVAFGRRSRALYREWDAEWGGAIGTWPTRWLNIFPAGEGPLVSRQAPGDIEARPLPEEFQPIGEGELGELEPDVRLPEGGTAVLVDGQLGVNPQRLVAALAARAGTVVTGVRMLGVERTGDRIITVRTTAGDFTPGAVVMATGLLPEPWRTRQRWVKGHMVAVAPGPWRLGSVLAGPLGGGTPLGDGTIFCGGSFDEGDNTPDVRPEVSDPMAEALATLVPKAAGARISHRWCCFRPYVEGRQPVVDRLPEVSNGWFAGGHFTTGIMMAAATGEAVAGWISEGRTPELVRTFSLAR